MTINETAARSSLPDRSTAAFDDIVTKRVLGANNHVRMIGEMIEAIVVDGQEQGSSTGDVKRRITNVTEFFIATRGVSAQAIPNALRLMIKGLNDYPDDAPLAETGPGIVQTKDAFQQLTEQAGEKVLEHASTLLGDAQTIMAFDYSSTVERLLVRLGGHGRTVIIPESRAINGGRPFVRPCLDAGYQVRYVPDVAIMHELHQCDAVLMGAETFFPDGTGFNTIGSDLVGLVCCQLDVPLYFLTTFQKLDIRNIYGRTKTLPEVDLAEEAAEYLPEGIGAKTIQTLIPELIGVRPEHIRAFVTEKGIIPANQLWGPSVQYFEELTGTTS